jgi:hypothetical protein
LSIKELLPFLSFDKTMLHYKNKTLRFRRRNVLECGAAAFFVRLGPRSPKDAPLNPCPPFGLSEDTIAAALAASQPPSDASDPRQVLRCFQDVAASLLRVTNADQALALLVKAELGKVVLFRMTSFQASKEEGSCRTVIAIL